MKYKDFDEWFNELLLYDFATRGERFYDEVQHMTNERAIEWLKAAWACARMEHE
jgi:hypothetical protein